MSVAVICSYSIQVRCVCVSVGCTAIILLVWTVKGSQAQTEAGTVVPEVWRWRGRSCCTDVGFCSQMNCSGDGLQQC